MGAPNTTDDDNEGPRPRDEHTLFHVGDVASAIARARVDGVPLLIAVHEPTDAASVHDGLDAAWRDASSPLHAELREWVALRLTVGSAAHEQFVSVYPVADTPAVVVVNPASGERLMEAAGAEATFGDIARLARALRTCREGMEARMQSAAMAALARAVAANVERAGAATATPPTRPVAPSSSTDGPPTVAAPEARDAPVPAPSQQQQQQQQQRRREMTRRRPSESPPTAGSDPTVSPSVPATDRDAVVSSTTSEGPSGMRRRAGAAPPPPSAAGVDAGVDAASGGDRAADVPDPAPAPHPPRPASVRVQVRLPDGATLVTEMAPEGATIGDVRAFLAASDAVAAAFGRGGFEIWNTWPRRVVSEDPADATLEALGLGARPSLLALPPRGGPRGGGGGSARGGGQPEARAPFSSAPAPSSRAGRLGPPRPRRGAGAGVLDVFLELLRRVWAAVSMFLGLGDVPGLGGSEGGAAARDTRTSPRDEALAASASARARATPSRGNVRTLGGGGDTSGATGSRTTAGAGGATAVRARRRNVQGNVHTLGSSGGGGEDGDGTNRFWNGNSTVWGGDPDGEGGGDGDDGGTMDVF